MVVGLRSRVSTPKFGVQTELTAETPGFDQISGVQGVQTKLSL